MKFSEAIRLGAMLDQQAYGHLDKDGTCAMGAALKAAGLNVWDFVSPYDAARERFPILNVDAAIPPAYRDRYCNSRSHAPVDAIVVGLNDQMRWTREQIADWVETIERAQEQPEEIAAQTQTVNA